MKRIVTYLITVLCVAQFSYAQKVSKEAAREKAASFMRELNGAQLANAQRQLRAAAKNQSAQADTSQPYYIFNAEDNKGYVIIGAISDGPEILGYSDKGQLDTDDMPAALNAMLNMYEHSVSNTTSTQLKAKKNIVTRENILLSTASWGQGSPYNNNLSLNNRRAYVGCVATATSIIMKYHQWPAASTAVIPGYSNNTTIGNISATLSELPVTSFDWGSMTDTYSSYSWGGSSTAKTAVAKLCQYVSQSIHSDYGTNGTNAFLYAPAKALREYFDYDPGLRLERPFDYTKTQWENLMYHELKSNRPILYNGMSGEAGEEVVGHAFISDGYETYNNEAYFHINWGWDGSSDGYFKLSLLSSRSRPGDTTSYEYSIHQEATIGIQKPTGKNETVIDQNLTDEGLTTTQDGVVTCIVYNDRPADYNIAWGIIDNNGNIIENLYTSETERTFPAETIIRTTGNLSSVASKPDGIYRIVPISQRVRSTYIVDEGTDWMPLAGWKRFYINAHVKNGQVTYVTHPAIEKWDAEGNMTYEEYAPQTSPTYVDNMPTTYTVGDDVVVANLYDVDFNETEVTPSQNPECLYFVKKYDAITDVSDVQTSEEYVPNLLGRHVIRGFVDYSKIIHGADFIRGDVNGDSEVNISDVTALVDYILGKATSYDASVCDVNADNEVNISDVTSLVDIILGK